MEINLKNIMESLEEEEKKYIEEASKTDPFIKGKYELAKIKTELELQEYKKQWDDISEEANKLNEELENDAFDASIAEAKEGQEKETIDFMEYLKAKKRAKRPPVIKRDWKSYRPGPDGKLIKIKDLKAKEENPVKDTWAIIAAEEYKGFNNNIKNDVLKKVTANQLIEDHIYISSYKYKKNSINIRSNCNYFYKNTA